MISREKIARVLESLSKSPSLQTLLAGISEDLARMESDLFSMLSGVAPNRNSHEHSSARMKKNLDTLVNSTIDFKALFAEVGINDIEDIRTKVFPRMVEYNIIQLLKVSSPSDLPRVNSTLSQLTEKGVSAVWERILPSLRAQAQQLCGLLFTEEYLQEGKTLPLDMAYLSSLVSPASVAREVLPVLTPRASAVAGSNNYMGLRHGFLNSPPKPTQKPRDQEPEVVTTRAENSEHNPSSVAP